MKLKQKAATPLDSAF